MAICTAGISVGQARGRVRLRRRHEVARQGRACAPSTRVNELIAPALDRAWTPRSQHEVDEAMLEHRRAGRQGAPGRQRHGGGLGGGAEGRRGGARHPALPAHRRRQRLHPARAGRHLPGGQRPLRQRRALRRQAELRVHLLRLRHLLRGLLRRLGHSAPSGREALNQKFGVPQASSRHAPAVPRGRRASTTARSGT